MLNLSSFRDGVLLDIDNLGGIPQARYCLCIAQAPTYDELSVMYAGRILRENPLPRRKDALAADTPLPSVSMTVVCPQSLYQPVS